MTKDLIDAIKERRSVRAFEDTPVPDATIGRLLESAHLAPSAGNLEPWKFIVVKQPDLRKRIAARPMIKILWRGAGLYRGLRRTGTFGSPLWQSRRCAILPPRHCRCHPNKRHRLWLRYLLGWGFHAG